MNSYLDEVQQWHIFELILASYNDAVLDDLINEKQTSRFLEVVNKSNANKKLTIIKDYWRKIYNEEEFPVGKLL